MMNTKQQVKQALAALLSDTVDPLLESEGFSRKSKSVKYTRILSHTKQEMEFHFDLRPRSNPEAIGDLIPHFTLLFPELTRIALDMVATDEQLLACPDITARQQFHNAAPGGMPIYWYLYGDDRDVECVRSIGAFIESWVLPLLNEFTDVAAITKAYEANDKRIPQPRHFLIYVAAAYVLLKSPEKAMGVLKEKLGRPGTRRTYHSVFDYVERIGSKKSA